MAPTNEDTVTEAGGRPRGRGRKPKPLSKDEFHSRIRRFRDDARGWIDTELANEQERYWRYYNGESDLKFETNRSSYVMRELHDGVEAALVSVNRIMLTANTPVEFRPKGPDDLELAQHQTDAAQHVFFHENMGYEMIQDGFRDGLVADYGVIKTYWDHSTLSREHIYEGLTEQELDQLANDPEVEMVKFLFSEAWI